MKKIISFMLILLMLFPFVTSCNENNVEETKTTDSSESKESQESKTESSSETKNSENTEDSKTTEAEQESETTDKELKIEYNLGGSSIQEDSVAVPGWGGMTIPIGTKDIKRVDFYNPAENAGKYYLQFELSLVNEDGTKGEMLYKSDLVAPGQHINSVTFSRGLEEGEYTANMFVQPYRMLSDPTPTNNTSHNLTLVVKGTDYPIDEEEESKPSGIAIPACGPITIPAGQTSVPMNLDNPIANEGNYYLQFELSLDNEDGSKGEVLFTSDLIAPGDSVRTVTLSRALEAGQYTGNLFVQPYKMSDNSTVNNMTTKVTITVVDDVAKSQAANAFVSSSSFAEVVTPDNVIADSEIAEIKIAYGVYQSYVGRIPASVNFDANLCATANIEIKKLYIAGNEQMSVLITSANQTGDEDSEQWWLVDKNGTSQKVEYSASVSTDAKLINGEKILSVKALADDDNKNVTVTFTANAAEKGGIYQDTLTFCFLIEQVNS